MAIPQRRRFRLVPWNRSPSAGTAWSEQAVTLSTFLAASPHRRLGTLFTRVVLLLTLAAGWTDVLTYLFLGTAQARVFSSFMTGNLLFVGVALAQGNSILLIRAVLAILVFLAGVTLGSISLQQLPERQSFRDWRRALAPYLLVEGLILLAFALLWQFTGNPIRHPPIQIALIGIAAFGMGMQGALAALLNIPDVISVALTGTELLLGIRLAQRIDRKRARPPAGTSTPFLLALLLCYVLGAFVAALAAPWFSISFIPCLLVLVAALLIRVTPDRECRSGSDASEMQS